MPTDTREINWQVGMIVTPMTRAEVREQWSMQPSDLPFGMVSQMMDMAGTQLRITRVAGNAICLEPVNAIDDREVRAVTCYSWHTMMVKPYEIITVVNDAVEVEAKKKREVLRLHKDLEWLRPILKPINKRIVVDVVMIEIFAENELLSPSKYPENGVTTPPHEDAFIADNQLGKVALTHLVEVEGRKYWIKYATTFAQRCTVCGEWKRLCRLDSNSRCERCTYTPQMIAAKTIPSAGWVKYGTAPYYGIELEYVAHACSGSGRDDVVEATRKNVAVVTDAIRTVAEAYGGWQPPLVLTDDSSLHGHGKEINFHPMGMDYIREHAEKLRAFFAALYANGARHALDDVGELAGLHIHRSSDDIDEDLTYLSQEHASRSIVRFLYEWSHRSADNWSHWCGSRYSVFARRNKRDTWEYRGYSASALLHPDRFDNLIALCEWVDCLAKATTDPTMYLLTPTQLAAKNGYDDLVAKMLDYPHANMLEHTGHITQLIKDHSWLKIECRHEQETNIYNREVRRARDEGTIYIGTDEVPRNLNGNIDWYLFGLRPYRMPDRAAFEQGIVDQYNNPLQPLFTSTEAV